MKRLELMLFTMLLFTCIVHAEALDVRHLTCEQIENPIGIGSPSPRLCWQVESTERNQNQTAYEIEVSTDKEMLLQGKKLVWKSGKVKSGETLWIKYCGSRLKPFTRYYWRVRVYNQNNEVSRWSDPAYWETAMLDEEDWSADWICDGRKAPATEDGFYKDIPVPLFRKDFKLLKEIKEARLYISGLGYYEAQINGNKVGDHVLDPGWTNFDKRILYSTYDITEMLKSGDNVIGVILGNGFYNPIPMPIFKKLRDFLTIGQPCLKAQIRITYPNGKSETICSDESWKWTEGPILRNNVYLGEKYDARKEIEDWAECKTDLNGWKNAEIAADAPKGKLIPQMQPPIRIREVIHPIRMTESKKGEFVFDMGQNFAGVAKIKVKGPAGTKITIRYGEDIYSDGSLNVMTSVAGQHKRVWDADREADGAPQTAWQEDTYILKGEGEEIWSPRFTFHGFRYVEITGWPGRPQLDDVEGLRLCSDLKPDGHFESSNEMFNKLNRNIDYTFLSNVFSVQSDCPAREKFGYGGDIVGVSRTFCYFYNMHNFYTKAINDFANDQRPKGGFTETAPYNGIGDAGLGDNSGPIGWQLAFAFLQKQLYEYYGDKEILSDNYPALQKQVDFLTASSKNFIIDRCINDHESLDSRIPALFATAHFYHHAMLIKEFSEVLNKKEDSKKYSDLAENIKKAFTEKFVSPTGQIGNGTPSEQAFALYYKLIPEGMDDQLVFNKLVEAVALRDNHISSGIFGTPIVLNMLNEYGRNDIAYQMANQKTFPGWGYMIEKGATTVWETWKYSDNVYSQNHPMFGSVGEWMYQALGGINPAEPGFKTVTVAPRPAGDLSWNKCSYNSIRGKIESNWEIDGNSLVLKVHIPANVRANIILPCGNGEASENGKKLSDIDGGKIIYSKEKECCINIPSGDYEFKCPKKKN